MEGAGCGKQEWGKRKRGGEIRGRNEEKTIEVKIRLGMGCGFFLFG
jgi:hypothetical protein